MLYTTIMITKMLIPISMRHHALAHPLNWLESWTDHAKILIHCLYELLWKMFGQFLKLLQSYQVIQKLHPLAYAQNRGKPFPYF